MNYTVECAIFADGAMLRGEGGTSGKKKGTMTRRDERSESLRRIHMAVRGETREDTRTRVREPKRYQVIMHNDDYTPMDFVVDILMMIFHKDESEANILMMKVHHEGEAAVGSYSYDVACSKQRAATTLAEEEGHPFRMTIREV